MAQKELTVTDPEVSGWFRYPLNLPGLPDAFLSDPAKTREDYLAAFGDKASAVTFAERSIALNPLEQDAVAGPRSIEILARVAARVGESDRAIATLEKLLSIPSEGPLATNQPLTPALLRLDPMFDSLRNDQRFQRIAAAETLAGKGSNK